MEHSNKQECWSSFITVNPPNNGYPKPTKNIFKNVITFSIPVIAYFLFRSKLQSEEEYIEV
jgi:hypothetical protein